jgi:hypothetical protein
METNVIIFARIVFTGLFLAVLCAGVYLLKNDRRLFGRDANLPSENGSARAYSRVQVYSLWGHALLLTGAFALLLH